MKKTLVLALATALGAIVVPAANAQPAWYPVRILTASSAPASSPTGDSILGGCFFLADSSALLTSGAYVGVIGDASVTRDPAGHPTAATVTCKIQVNGSDVYGSQHSYRNVLGVAVPGVQLGVDQLVMNALDTDTVSLCEHVLFADGTTTGWICQSATSAMVPPQQTMDLLYGPFASLIDPAVCPLVGSHLAGSYGGETVVISSSGDVSVTGDPVYDCPPYAL